MSVNKLSERGNPLILHCTYSIKGHHHRRLLFFSLSLFCLSFSVIFLLFISLFPRLCIFVSHNLGIFSTLPFFPFCSLRIEILWCYPKKHTHTPAKCSCCENFQQNFSIFQNEANNARHQTYSHSLAMRKIVCKQMHGRWCVCVSSFWLKISVSPLATHSLFFALTLSIHGDKSMRL